MTPDRDALLPHRFPLDAEPGRESPGRETPGRGTSTPAPRIDLDAVVTGAAVPTPRPEILARVLEGLRELPTQAAPARRAVGSDDADAPTSLPLPRRR